MCGKVDEARDGRCAVETLNAGGEGLGTGCDTWQGPGGCGRGVGECVEKGRASIQKGRLLGAAERRAQWGFSCGAGHGAVREVPVTDAPAGAF